MRRKTATDRDPSQQPSDGRPNVGQRHGSYSAIAPYGYRPVMDSTCVSGVGSSEEYYAHQDMSGARSSLADSMSWLIQADVNYAACEQNQHPRNARAQMHTPQLRTHNLSPTDHSHMPSTFAQSPTLNAIFNPQLPSGTQPGQVVLYANAPMNIQGYARPSTQPQYLRAYWSPSSTNNSHPLSNHPHGNGSFIGSDEAGWDIVSPRPLQSMSSYVRLSPRSRAEDAISLRDTSPNVENQVLPQSLNRDLLGVADTDRFLVYSNIPNSNSASPLENATRSPGLSDYGVTLTGPLSPPCEAKAAPLPVSKKRRQLDQAGRENAKQMRRIHPCLRCKTMKIKCDGGNPCENCRRVATSFRVWYEPCSREDLGSVSIVRRGNGKFGQATAEIVRYLFIDPSKPPRTINLQWSIPGYTKKILPTWEVDVHEFTPRDGDITKEEWNIDGRPTVIELPPFASYDDSKLRKSHQTWVAKTRPIVQQVMLDSSLDKLTSLTLREAQRYAETHNSNIIALALRIWSTAKLTQGWASIVGDDTLNTPQIDRAEDGFCGSRPISPALCHQIDVMFLDMLYADERSLLRELKKKLFPKKQDSQATWYEIFLAYFVMVTHLEFIHGAAMSFMQCRLNTTSANRVSPIVTGMVGKWDYSAKNLLCHFRNVLRGMLPFELAKKNIQEVKERASLDDMAVKFLESALRCLEEKEQELQKTKDQDMNLKAGTVMVDGRWVRCLFRDASYKADGN